MQCLKLKKKIVTIFHCKLLTREGRVLSNGWTYPSSMTIFVHLFIRRCCPKSYHSALKYYIYCTYYYGFIYELVAMIKVKHPPFTPTTEVGVCLSMSPSLNYSILLTNKGPLHTWDWEPVTIKLQALSLVEKAEVVQIRFTLRLRDQPSMWMQDGYKVYMDFYMASNGLCFMITWIIFKHHFLEAGLT